MKIQSLSVVVPNKECAKYRISRIYEYKRHDGSFFRVFINLRDELISWDCENINEEFIKITNGKISFEEIITPKKEEEFDNGTIYDIYMSNHFERILKKLCYASYKVIEVYNDGSFFILFDRDCHPGELEYISTHNRNYNWKFDRITT